MSNDDEAQAAIEALDNTDLGGRTIALALLVLEKREPRREDRGNRRDY